MSQGDSSSPLFEDADRSEQDRLSRKYSFSLDHEEQLREIVADEEVRAERAAARYKMFFSFAFFLFAFVSRLSGRPIEEFISQIVTLGVFFGFNLVIYIRIPRRPAPWLAYLSSFTELTILSALNYFQARFTHDPTLIYTSPMTLLYFIMVVLSAYRNRVRVILFSMAVVAVEYSILAILFWPEMRQLNINLKELAAEINPAQFAVGSSFSIVTGRPVGIGLKILYIMAAGAAAIMAIRSAQRIATRQTRMVYEATVERLLELDRLKTNFITNMSHEFRTPLTLILGPIESLLYSAAPGRNRERLEIVRRNALSLLDMINNLLDTSRFAAGKMQIQREVIDLAAFSRERVHLFRPGVAARGLAIHVDEPEEPVYIEADPRLLERVYLNLMGNSLKFTETGEIRIHVAAEADQALISFLDTGRGIPREARGRLFERFANVHDETALPGQGSGLGLSLVHEIVTAHGGTIDYAERAGGGSEFQVRLPRAVARAETRPASAPSSPVAPPSTVESPLADRGPAFEPTADFQTHTVLIVEDKADMRDYLRSLLEERYAIITAEDGMAGLEAARSQRPDLILSDVMMPRMDGFRFLEAVRSDHDLQNTPFLLLTAKTEAGTRVAGLNRGADDFIAKPFHPDELTARVARSLYRLDRHRGAINGFREELTADLHDHLGGTLTDLSISLRRARKSGEFTDVDESMKQVLEAFKACLSGDGANSRVGENFADQLHGSLIMRYARAGREIEFTVDEKTRARCYEIQDTDLFRELYAITREVATNDLKYGERRSRWRLRSRKSLLVLRLDAQARADSLDNIQSPGLGRATLDRRAKNLNARTRETTKRDRYRLSLYVPLTGLPAAD